MSRKFVKNDDNKVIFLNITLEGLKRTIATGILGEEESTTEEEVVEFKSQTEIVTESSELIEEMINDGYFELFSDLKVFDREGLSEEDLEETFFWEIIERYLTLKQVEDEGYDYDDHIEYITTYLSHQTKENILVFEKTLQRLLLKLDCVEIAELNIILESPFEEEDGSYIFDASLSDDGFLYFRCWIILQGYNYFTDALDDINSLCEYDLNNDIEYIAEELLYVSDNAYTMGHDEDNESEIRDIILDKYGDELDYDVVRNEYTREEENGAGLQKRYPDFVAKVCNMRSE